jgi:hypothetical protein
LIAPFEYKNLLALSKLWVVGSKKLVEFSKVVRHFLR